VRMFAALTLGLSLLCATSYAREPINEAAGIALIKRTTASTLDPDLPNRPFAAWITEKFPDWDVHWTFNDCGEAAGDPKVDAARDMPACVQVDIMQPAQVEHGHASRGFHITFQVGTQKKGLAPPRFRFATRQEDDESEYLKHLSEVEP
jgi:hypothetical protein